MFTRGEVVEVQRDGFERLLANSPAATKSVLEQLCDRVRQLDSAVFG